MNAQDMFGLKLTKPYGDISSMDNHFIARLHFFKKGCSYHIYLEGESTIENENRFPDQLFGENEVLLRFQVSKVDYLPLKPERRKKFVNNLIGCFATLFAKEHDCKPGYT